MFIRRYVRTGKRINSFRRAVDETSCCYKRRITNATCSPGFFALKRYKFQHRSLHSTPPWLAQLPNKSSRTFSSNSCCSRGNSYTRPLSITILSNTRLSFGEPGGINWRAERQITREWRYRTIALHEMLISVKGNKERGRYVVTYEELLIEQREWRMYDRIS